MYQLDIKTVFLHGNLQGGIYASALGYEVQGETKKTCKLKKGNLQYPWAWFDKFSTVFAHYGLRWSSSDHSIFVWHSFASTVIFTVYVDNIIVTEDDRYYLVESLVEFSFLYERP